ncbi:MAG: ABC transporter ATP-binding protein [Chloroflexi bacterium HGW-Chloroflexi-3]|nr:MAG: ABC transporter ATP-binding protein [Chloroflexi bacterium HGW-Chloroflexi-3]
MFHVKQVENKSMEKIIEVSHLKHKYGDFQAIQDLSFDVQKGEVFGLLGPNGAGKTTTVRLLNGMFEASGGEISVMGFDPMKSGEKIREKAGVLTETPALYERLTARQNLRFFGVLAGMDDQQIERRSDELLEMFDLSHRADDRAGTFSKGMKQRLALSRAWLTNPKLLFLDEPTSGLDPEAAVQVRELIADVRQKEGITVLICTHNLDEAQRLCDRLLIMRQGSALAMGSLSDLQKLVSPGMWLEVQLLSPFEKMDQIRTIAGVLNLYVHSLQEIKIEVESEAAIPQVVSGLVALGALILRLQPQQIPLEQVYLQLQNNNHKGHNGGVK